jgi:ubiquinone/menaquinone biosynthesis C-methylase UbiE
MKINYQETTSDLLKRINIHDQFGGRNIDEWMLELLQLKPGMKILDAACGAGKQCISFYNELKGDCDITGGDVSEELLAKAKQETADKGYDIKFIPLNFNERFPFEDNTFDLLSCCFAIYYSEDIPFTIREMHRVLKPGGRLFTDGPMPQNKKVFYDIIREATNNKEIPPMPGSSRYESGILSAMRDTFSKVDVNIFENPLTFKTAAPFIEYTGASLSEDRKLWHDFFTGKEGFEEIMKDITNVAEAWVKRDGQIVMTKVVGGFVATK